MIIDDFCKILRLNADQDTLLTQDINNFELDWKAANKNDPITHPLSIEKDGEDAWSEVFDYFRDTRKV